MRMERRERQNLNREQVSPSGRRASRPGSTTRNLELNSWARIGLSAKNTEIVFNNLFSHINVENLRQAFQSLDGSKAVGIDGISKINYAKDLEQNLESLVSRIHIGTYRPQAKREVLIPKANGKTRPIAISCFEDKLVEWVLGKVLESVYEPIFIRNSFGFRPRRSPDDAIRANFNILKDNKRPFVVEIDLANFFNTVPHRKLMTVLQERISDRKLLGLIARFLKVDIQNENGITNSTEVGTPQGSVMSPILSNIFLNKALDQWFVKSHSSHDAVIVRYADDAVFMFGKEQQANDFLVVLKLRLKEYGLSLNEDKTAIINFTKGRENIFNFLGFTFFWNKKKGWNKSCRSMINIKEIWSITAAKLRGHYNYYGYFCNRGKLMLFYQSVIGDLFKWLNRRSQKKSFNWMQFKKVLNRNPLPRPPETTKLKSLGWSPYVK